MFFFNDTGKNAVDGMLKSCSAIAQGVQAVSGEATSYSRKSYEDNSAALERLFGARTVEQILEIQSEFAKANYEGLIAQASRIGEIYADTARKAYAPFEAATPSAKPAAPAAGKPS